MSEVTVRVKDNGPFLLQGDFSIVDAEGHTFDTDGKATALCRCGASTNQPFCTGNHQEIGFESAPRVSDS
ncbi:CDGSH iron-sulfur domain-containing protein [cf. Phormidesmis sp. LEGE 11477]|uniref:CDGSH iron-sulfur domain-containing protein n=1 Tax=cf. Phormidesmis sp. LEGE 11477 TaxID=1828680 RepID=UPI00187E4FE9|nr:CDGSH iron-sulfur domain-containing protein [cf. Phormidesmis sp. LEGE 11477]MBE9064603.1 CDGSH iron-sulfur domain-containing protein [cf. Phormidesmis sp. LEGE 11477]